MVRLFSSSYFVTALFSVQVACSSVPNSGSCRATPGSRGWPNNTQWAKLNKEVSGRLIKATPPAASCHKNQPSYNTATCAYIQAAWGNSTFHDQDPVSVDNSNWTDECCLPDPSAPCSGEGYPVYVINATSAAHVKAGVDFALENNIRLIVKSSGHDYIGRSVAPNSLSIWTHYMKNIQFHDTFTPKGCRDCIDSKAVTVGAGTQMIDIYEAGAPHNLTIVGGMDITVSVGGFLTAGGHSPLSSTYGLGADQVLEMEVVTANGEILTVNECQHSDIFWALRGGGGASFGVIISFTIRAFPSPSVSQVTVYLGTAMESDAYWNTMAYILSDNPRLSDAGVSGYTYFLRNVNDSLSGYFGLYFKFDSTYESLLEDLAPIEAYYNTKWPNQFSTLPGEMKDYPDFLSWWETNVDPTGVGGNTLLGSRLLDRQALSQPLAVIESTLKAAVPFSGAAISHIVAGKGVHNAKPAGGSNSVLPAWRNAYSHFVVSQGWPPLNETAKNAVYNSIAQETAALRKLAPNSGSYINEGDAFEPNYQQAFWGANYPRLLAIKRSTDPGNLFWCHPCVGDEGWEEVGDKLCKK